MRINAMGMFYKCSNDSILLPVVTCEHRVHKYRFVPKNGTVILQLTPSFCFFFFR